MQLIHMEMEYFSSSQCQNTPGNIVCGSGTCALNLCENEIFQELLVPKYFGEYCFAFGVICALNKHEIGNDEEGQRW